MRCAARLTAAWPASPTGSPTRYASGSAQPRRSAPRERRPSGIALRRSPSPAPSGMAIHPKATRCRFNWDGVALYGATEAFVILHEVAHFALAPPERRGLVEFGLGPGPDTLDRAAADRAVTLSPLERAADEAPASLLRIIW